MKLTKKIRINRSADDVWKIVAEDFDHAHKWMGGVYSSDAKGPGQSSCGAPMQGRVCVLSEKPNGLYADETITQYNSAKKQYTMEVFPKNAPAIMPVTRNTVKVSVHALSPEQSECIWELQPELKPLAKPLSPLIKVGLHKAFGKILKDLKTYSETSHN